MEYYKLINGGGWDFLEKGRIYKEDEKPEKNNPCIIQDYVTDYPQDFQKVPESEYLLQEARKRYPVGSKFRVSHYPDLIRTVKSHAMYELTLVNKDANQLHINFLTYEDNEEGASVYSCGTWAEIISTPKEEKSESNVKEVKMTHKEAIEELKHVPVITEKQRDAINYAIEQLNKCEVFPEPVEMEVWDNGGDKHINQVFGKIENKYLCKNNGLDFISFDNAQSIKKKALKFTEWFEKNHDRIIRDKNDYQLWNDVSIDYVVNVYNEYLNNFNKQK